MEAAFTCLAVSEKFTPVSLNITELDPEAAGVRVVTQPVQSAPRIALSNSSAFGGSNVALTFSAID